MNVTYNDGNFYDYNSLLYENEKVRVQCVDSNYEYYGATSFTYSDRSTITCTLVRIEYKMKFKIISADN